MTDHPLVNIGDLTKPATVLIEKISDAVGGMFKPRQLVRVARAEAEVERIRAETRIQVSDLERRALDRFVHEEGRKQANIEEITQRALPLLNEAAAPENVANDWITNFFDKSRIVSDGDMQQLWSRVLAGEANVPGAFSRKTVNLLADLDKGDAELFTKLCGFGWKIGERLLPLIFNAQTAIYNQDRIDFDALVDLESLGLLQFNDFSGFIVTTVENPVRISYYGRGVDLTVPKELDVGHVLLTRAGQELAAVSGATPAEGFFDFVYERWAAESLVPKEGAEQDAQGV